MWDSQAFIGKAKLYGDMSSRSENTDSELGIFLSICIEMLAKAALSKEHPALLAGKDHLISALRPTANEYSVHAASVSDILARLAALHLGPKSRIIRDLEKLISYRNAEIHSSINSFESTGKKLWLPLAVSGIRYLADLIKMEDTYFLSAELLELADDLIDLNQSELHQRVQREISEARHAWNSLTPEQKQLNRLHANAISDFEVIKCPVCESSLRITPEARPIDSTIERTRDGYERVNAYQLKMAHCSACGLGLNTAQELVAATISDTAFKIESVELDDLYELGFYEEYGDE